MNRNHQARTLTGEDLAEMARRNGLLALTALRIALYAVLIVFRPLVSIGLLALTCACTAVCLFSLTFPPGTHFPGILIATIGVLSAALNAGYSVMLGALQPNVRPATPR